MLVALEFSCLFSRRFRLLLLQSEDGVVKDLPESIVVEFTHGHFLVFILLLQVLEHLLEHRLLVTRSHTLFKATFLLNLSLFLIRVKIDLVVKVLCSVRLLVAVLELCLDLLQHSG